jgi:excisionase family DNA binding protein
MESGTVVRLMTVQDVAEMLNVKPSWVYGKVASREIPHVHVGRYPRFVRDDVLAWVAGHDGRS